MKEELMRRLVLAGDGSAGEDLFASRLEGRFGNFLLHLLLASDSFAFGFGESLAKSFNSACGVDQFLLAGEKRMARGADVDFDQADRRASLELVPTGTPDRRCIVFGVDIRL